MALYSYQALNKSGKKVTGSMDAPSSQSVREQLQKQNLYPIRVKQTQTSTGFSIKQLFARKVSDKDIIFFTKQLGILLKSGVPLLDALGLLVDQTSGNLRSVVSALRDHVKEGVSLADALEKYPNIFSKIYVQLIRAGEASGKLEEILERLTDYLEKQQALRKKVRGALTYPFIQLAVILGITVILLVYVVPQLAENFATQGATLPGSTRTLISISDFFRYHYILLITGLFGIYVAYRAWKATARGKLIIDSIKLKLPIVGNFARKNAIVQFSQTLGLLIQSGVNLAEALDIVCKIVDNQILVQTLQEARDKIIKQGKVAQYLKQTGLFPPMAIYLIKTGEQSGQLGAMLLTVADHYETELADLADNLTTLLSPFMLLLMTGIVGFIISAIMTPLVSMNELMQ